MMKPELRFEEIIEELNEAEEFLNSLKEKPEYKKSEIRIPVSATLCKILRAQYIAKKGAHINTGDKEISDRIYTVDEIRDLVLPLFKEQGIDNVYLFGSYARGDMKAYSDINLCVDKFPVNVINDYYVTLFEGLDKLICDKEYTLIALNDEDEDNKEFFKCVKGEMVKL